MGCNISNSSTSPALLYSASLDLLHFKKKGTPQIWEHAENSIPVPLKPLVFSSFPGGSCVCATSAVQIAEAMEKLGLFIPSMITDLSLLLQVRE